MTSDLDASIVIDCLATGVANRWDIAAPFSGDPRFAGFCDAADDLLAQEPGYTPGDFAKSVRHVYEDLGTPQYSLGSPFTTWRAEFVLRVFQDLEARIW